MRAVIDTNVWISAVLNPAGLPSAIRFALQNDRFTLVTSQPLLTELVEVFGRPRFARTYGVTTEQISKLVDLLTERAEIVEVTGTLNLCRDPDDDVVIETAFAGRAHAIVTRDDDLKGVRELTSILSTRGLAVPSVQRFLDSLED